MAGIKRSHDDDDDIFECPVCLEMFDCKERKPKGLRCHHTVCLPCLVKIVDEAGGNKVKCPICQQEEDNYISGTDVDKGFPDNLTVKKLLNRNLLNNAEIMKKRKREKLEKIESDIVVAEKEEKESVEQVHQAAEKMQQATENWQLCQKRTQELKEEARAIKAELNGQEQVFEVGISEIKNCGTTSTKKPYEGREMKEILGEEKLNNPSCVASLGDGNYVLTEDHRLQIFSLDGATVAYIGQEGEGPGQFKRPHGVAVRDNEILVCDTGNKRIQVIGRGGTFIREIILDVEPVGICVAGSEGEKHAYVVHRTGILVFSYEWTMIRKIESVFFQSLHDVAYHHGFLYAPDWGSYEIHVITPLGDCVKVLGKGQISLPYGIVIDKVGNLIVGEYKRVTIMSQEGEVLTRLGVRAMEWVTGVCLTENNEILAVAVTNKVLLW